MSVLVGEGVVTSIIWISVSSLSEYRSINTGILQGDIFRYFHSAQSQERDRQRCLLSPSASHAFPPYTSTLIWSPPCLHLQFSLFPASCWNACCSAALSLWLWAFLALLAFKDFPQSQHAFNGLLWLWNDIHYFQVCLDICFRILSETDTQGSVYAGIIIFYTHNTDGEKAKGSHRPWYK